MEKNISRITGESNIYKKYNLFIATSKNIRLLHKWFIPVIVYGYAFLYMYTGYDKLHDIERFIKGISKISGIGQYAELIGWGIPLIEILLAIMLIVPRVKTQRWALWGSVILMGIFCAYISYMLIFVENRMCNCGGIIESMGWKTHLIFNIFWLATGIYTLKNSQ